MPGESHGAASPGGGGLRVTLNAAVSMDGRIAAAGGRRLILSDLEDQRRVHRLRSAHDAILVGVGTVLADDCSLRVRDEWVEGARQPLRVVLDSKGRVPGDARVLAGGLRTRVYCAEPASGCAHLVEAGAEVVAVPRRRDGLLDLGAVLLDLERAGVRSLLVEGGSRVIASFLEGGHVDEVLLFVAPVVVGRGAPGLVDRVASDGLFASFVVREVQSRASGVLLSLEPRRER